MIDKCFAKPSVCTLVEQSHCGNLALCPRKRYSESLQCDSVNRFMFPWEQKHTTGQKLLCTHSDTHMQSCFSDLFDTTAESILDVRFELALCVVLVLSHTHWKANSKLKVVANYLLKS